MKSKQPETFYMVDIETTGTRREKKDKILQLAAVPLMKDSDGFFRPALEPNSLDKILEDDTKEISLLEVFKGISRVKRPVFNRKVYYSGQPETIFAKEHMSKLYAECNALDPAKDSIEEVINEFRRYLHGGDFTKDYHNEPKRMIGWNASNFDLEFLFDYGMVRSHYVEVDGKDKLIGDMHYQVYEIGGLIHGMISITGFDNKMVKDLALAACPDHVKFDVKGISHDGLDDCYYQCNLLNGLIALGRSGLTLRSLQGPHV